MGTLSQKKQTIGNDIISKSMEVQDSSDAKYIWRPQL